MAPKTEVYKRNNDSIAKDKYSDESIGKNKYSDERSNGPTKTEV